MNYNFDQPLVREGSGAVKFDSRKAYFGTQDVMPLWVADMDFAVPDAITQALVERIQHPVFGYSLYPDSLYEALINWFSRRHGWQIKPEWILMAPGVVPSLFAAVQAFSTAGEGVIVQPPVYFPFYSAVTTNQRQLVLNPLRLSQGQYQIDFEQLETCAQQGARLLLLCTPHNPVGRVWREQELQALLSLARRYDMTILSDDIHCDLVYPEATHTMLGRLAQEGDKIITAVAPNKSFNIPGLGLSALIVPDAQQRKTLQHTFELSHAGNHNPLSMVAFEAAYNHGDEWLDQLLQYLKCTRDFACEFIAAKLPQISCIKPEATYLLWLNCRDMDLTDAQLRHFFVSQCGLGMNPGAVFGQGGEGFMRMNIGTPKANIELAMERIKQNLT